MNISAKGTLNHRDGTLAIDLEFSPNTELDQEILAKFLDGTGKIQLMHGHRGDILQSSLVIFNAAAFHNGQHNLENKVRIRDGRPTIEHENAIRARTGQPSLEQEAKNRDENARRKSQGRPSIEEEAADSKIHAQGAEKKSADTVKVQGADKKAADAKKPFVGPERRVKVAPINHPDRRNKVQ